MAFTLRLFKCEITLVFCCNLFKQIVKSVLLLRREMLRVCSVIKTRPGLRLCNSFETVPKARMCFVLVIARQCRPVNFESRMNFVR